MSGYHMNPRLSGTLPYTYAKTGKAARNEITKMLAAFGCTQVGFMDDFDRDEVILQFEHRGNRIAMRLSARGWARIHLSKFPWTTRMKVGREAYEEGALAQGQIAVNSMLRDWIKGQLTAIECGMMEFDEAFLPYLLMPSGKTVAETFKDNSLLLPGGGDANH